MRLPATIFILSLLIACSEADRTEAIAKQSPQTANLLISPVSAVVQTNSGVASAPLVTSESGVLSVSNETPVPAQIEFKPKFKATDPAAPIEVAVLDVMKTCQHCADAWRFPNEVAVLDLANTPDSKGNNDVRVIIPVVSVPMHPEQFSVSRDDGVDIAEKFEEAIDRQGVNDDLKIEESEVVVNVRKLVVAEYNHMSSIPDVWVDSEGNEYTPIGAGQFFHEVAGGAVGFISEEYVPNGRVVLNRLEGFAAKRDVPSSEWKKWPGLLRELSDWGKKQLDACQDKIGCKKEIDWLIAPEHLEGLAYEYSVAGGRKLRFVQGGARGTKAVLEECRFNCTDRTVVDELRINLWMYANADGTTQALRGGGAGFDSIVLVDHYCESQCGAGWTGLPSVISSNGQTVIVGSYSGGTLRGYIVFEVLPNELKYVGRFAWGS